MTVEKFLDRMKQCKETGNEFGVSEVVCEFGCEISDAIANAINGCVCTTTSLVVASVLESYASSIREAHKNDMLAQMTELIFKACTKQEIVSVKVPINKEK